MLRTVTATANALASVKAFGGWYITETAGAAARIRLRQGGVTGQIIADITFAANEKVPFSTGGEPVGAPGGVFLEVVSGTVQATLLAA